MARMAKSTKQDTRISRESRKKPEEMVEYDIPEELPVVPVKDLVPFPSVMMSLLIGRPGSLKAVNLSQKTDDLVFVVAQRNEIEDPAAKDLYETGVVAHILKVLTPKEEGTKILIQGLVRAHACAMRRSQGALIAKIRPVAPQNGVKGAKKINEIVARVRQNLQLLVEHESLPEEILVVTEQIDDPAVFADVILAHYRLAVDAAQNLLEESDPMRRLLITDSLIQEDVNRFLVSEQIRDKAREELSKDQREYYLREQIKQIQKELGEEGAGSEDLTQLRRAIEGRKMPRPAFVESMKQLQRLEHMGQESSEYALLRTYLDWMVELPWSVRTRDRVDLKAASKMLEEDHFGLERAKSRILEYLSVRKLKPDSKGSILCFVGPPGVGKTSLGRSIARALNRRFFRMSLGGVRDEAEIRGHRRTYVGALPGRILQGVKQAGSRNSVFVLDELDKVGADFRGDPSSALLEVLDPEQNRMFRDHYLNVDFDLSETIFIATANTVDTIPDALLDRLEVIDIQGYTNEEKLEIAKKFLIPKQLLENGLKGKNMTFPDKLLLFLIDRYTRESGVRNLEREIGSICRKVAREFAESGKLVRVITKARLEEFLGPTRYDPDTTEKRPAVGLARGLAWTVTGGELLPVEASIARGKGALSLTGHLGQIMQESAQAAVFYARANAEHLGLDPDFHEKYDIHIHAPGGSIPKDGPSAGITIAAALVSALSNKKIRSDVSMTGEITLRGNVLAIGGIKEKALAALRYNIPVVIIPHENMKDLDDIPDEQRRQIDFIPVKHIGEVFDVIFDDDAGFRRKRRRRNHNGGKRKKVSTSGASSTFRRRAFSRRC